MSIVFTPWPVAFLRWWRDPQANQKKRRWVTLGLSYVLLFIVLIPLVVQAVVGNRYWLVYSFQVVGFYGRALLLAVAFLALLVSLGRWLKRWQAGAWWSVWLRRLGLFLWGLALFLLSSFFIIANAFGWYRFLILAVVWVILVYFWRRPSTRAIWKVWGWLALAVLTVTVVLAAASYLATLADQPWNEPGPLYSIF